MSEQCPKCNHEMKFIGNWPDFSDRKTKETYVCDHCYIPGSCRQTVRRERVVEQPNGLQ